ncbi:DNA-directed RNA polymerases I, II, and III subunit RPABC2 isoform X2 [Aquarana catesbeiana]|uniref:DNA-directed RNA polymerases I, II, and III subunit RPABC2 isoform X2 n=1 Tax=Aquarana catesbeiana TaxID=8400 RepID=UPI003CC9E716
MSDNEDNFDGDDFDDVEEDEGLDDLDNAEEEDRENVAILPAGEGQQANQKRITTNYMTKYERARVLGTRALQIAWTSHLSGCRPGRLPRNTVTECVHLLWWSLKEKLTHCLLL